MEASSSYVSTESCDVVQNEGKTTTLGSLWRIFGKVLLAGIGFFIGCFLGLLLALYTGLLEFVIC